MSQSIQPKSYRNLKDGLITPGAVSEDFIPDSAVIEAVNMHFDKIGAAVLREGITALGNQVSGEALGMYEFRDSGSGTNNQIIIVNGTDVRYLSSGTWSSKRTVTDGYKARFTTFLDFAWMVNGVDATAIWSGDPSAAFLTTGNAASAPIGKYIENFRARVWIAGNSTYPDRLYYSSLPSAVTTPIITWNTDVATGTWIDIAPSDGENITGLKRTKSSLLVFKNNHIYRVFSVNETEPDPKINVGTYSQESIVEAKNGVYFHHPTGIFQYSDGNVNEISRPVIDFIKNISLSNYSKISGWEDGDHCYWSIGDVTIGDTTFGNIVLRYTISTKVWTVYSYPTQFLVSSKYNDGTDLFQLVGDESGNVFKVNIGVTDNSTPIAYSLVHNWYDVDGSQATRKTITKMLFAHVGGSGTKVSYQVEDDVENDWSSGLGEFGQRDTFFTNISVRGRKCRFKILGQSYGVPFIYYGPEILEGNSELAIS